MEHHQRRHQQSRPAEQKTVDPLKDMMSVAEVVLGPQFDEDGKQLWWTEADTVSAVGLAVTNGTDYFIYEKSNINTPNRPAAVGLKRVIFRPDGLKRSVATMAIRAAGEEFNPRPSYPNK